MLTMLTGMRFSQTGTGITRSLAILPVGVFKTDKYGKMNLSEKVCDELIASFAAGMPRSGVFIDVDHDFGKSRGWIKSLGYGMYTTDDGVEKPALVAEVEYTSEGEQMLADGEYKGVSTAFGPHTDPETGVKYAAVIRAVSLTNMPVMTMLPEPLDESVRLLAGDDVELVTLGDVVDKVIDEDDGELPRDLWAAAWGIWPATSAFEELVREALKDGLTGDDLKARVNELAADLPDALFEAIRRSVESEKAEPYVEAPQEPVAPADPTLSDTGDAPVTHEDPASMARGGNMEVEKKLAEAEAERDKLAAELAEIKAAERKSKVDAVLATLAIDEASRKGLEAVMLSEPGQDVLLSEGAEPMQREDALLSVLENVVIVPTGTKTAGEQPNPALEVVQLSEETKQVAAQMGVEMTKEA